MCVWGGGGVGAGGGGEGVKMLFKKTCEEVHLFVKLPAIEL